MNQEKQKRYDNLYMDIADRVACMSYARRKQVGCLIVKDGRIISMGWNGTPSGDPNECEHVLHDGSLVTKPEVLHAEANALSKLNRSTDSSAGATMYVTCSPCLLCAKQILSCGITEVVYKEYYVNSIGDGIDFLKNRSVNVRPIEE
jgi:dCMP deaminase